MKLHAYNVVSAIAGWVAAITLGIEGSVDPQRATFFWAVMIATWATIPTLWLVFDYNRNRLREEFVTALRDERQRTDKLVRAVAREFAEAELPKIQRIGERLG